MGSGNQRHAANQVDTLSGGQFYLQRIEDSWTYQQGLCLEVVKRPLTLPLLQLQMKHLSLVQYCCCRVDHRALGRVEGSLSHCKWKKAAGGFYSNCSTHPDSLQYYM